VTKATGIELRSIFPVVPSRRDIHGGSPPHRHLPADDRPPAAARRPAPRPPPGRRGPHPTGPGSGRRLDAAARRRPPGRGRVRARHHQLVRHRPGRGGGDQDPEPSRHGGTGPTPAGRRPEPQPLLGRHGRRLPPGREQVLARATGGRVGQRRPGAPPRPTGPQAGHDRPGPPYHVAGRRGGSRRVPEGRRTRRAPGGVAPPAGRVLHRPGGMADRRRSSRRRRRTGAELRGPPRLPDAPHQWPQRPQSAGRPGEHLRGAGRLADRA